MGERGRVIPPTFPLSRFVIELQLATAEGTDKENEQGKDDEKVEKA